jgi:hypothetical protein
VRRPSRHSRKRSKPTCSCADVVTSDTLMHAGQERIVVMYWVHLRAESRGSNSMAVDEIMTGLAQIERALMEAGARSWPWVEVGSEGL